MRTFNRTFSFVRIFMTLVFILIIGTILFRGYLILDAKNNKKQIYEIQVNNFQRIESYFTTEYTKDEKTGCITFKDDLGIKHVVCNNYTISEY